MLSVATRHRSPRSTAPVIRGNLSPHARYDRAGARRVLDPGAAAAAAAPAGGRARAADLSGVSPRVAERDAAAARPVPAGGEGAAAHAGRVLRDHAARNVADR